MIHISKHVSKQETILWRKARMKNKPWWSFLEVLPWLLLSCFSTDCTGKMAWKDFKKNSQIISRVMISSVKELFDRKSWNEITKHRTRGRGDKANAQEEVAAAILSPLSRQSSSFSCILVFSATQVQCSRDNHFSQFSLPFFFPISLTSLFLFSFVFLSLNLAVFSEQWLVIESEEEKFIHSLIHWFASVSPPHSLLSRLVFHHPLPYPSIQSCLPSRPSSMKSPVTCKVSTMNHFVPSPSNCHSLLYVVSRVSVNVPLTLRESKFTIHWIFTVHWIFAVYWIFSIRWTQFTININIHSWLQIESLTRGLVLTNGQLEKVSGILLDEFNRGLSKETNEQATVKMFPTYVRDVPDGSEQGKILSLDLGGTNFRVLLIDLKGKEFKMDNRVFPISQEIMLGSGEQLFDHIAACLASFMIERHLQNVRLPLGFTFSFPCAQEGLTKARLVKWTKGFKCSGCIDQDVVELLRAALRRRNDVDIDVTAVLNDTTGALMSCAHKNRACRVGLIVGKSLSLSLSLLVIHSSLMSFYLLHDSFPHSSY